MSFGYYTQRPVVNKFFKWDGEESTRLALEEWYGWEFILQPDGTLTYPFGSIEVGHTLINYSTMTDEQLEANYQVVPDFEPKEYQLV